MVLIDIEVAIGRFEAYLVCVYLDCIKVQLFVLVRLYILLFSYFSFFFSYFFHATRELLFDDGAPADGCTVI